MVKKKKSIFSEFSLSDFLRAKKDPIIQFYGPESMDEEGNLMSFSDQAAIITHYIKLKDSDEGVIFESKARIPFVI